MRVVLICHQDEPLNRYGLARWLASFSQLAGIVVLDEPKSRILRRVRAEYRRSGLLRLLDVFAFRLCSRMRLAESVRAHESELLAELSSRYPEVPLQTPVLTAKSPNSAETEAFVRQAEPDIVIARCRVLLKEAVFTIPRAGTMVMHPGVCPEYRNAHCCFWALANGEPEMVGMTLLRVDKGIDTGPVFGYYSYPYDGLTQSHAEIQNRVVFENLGALADKLLEIGAGAARPIDTTGRRSAVWGQPCLTQYLGWRRRTRRARKHAISLLYHDVVQPGQAETSGFPGGDAAIYKLTEAQFTSHIETLSRRMPSPPSTVLELNEGGNGQETPVLLTFDDGGVSGVRIAELLDPLGWKAHFLITTNYIGKPEFLSPDQIRELRAMGHIIGSHSCSHPPRMSQCSVAGLRDEWKRSVGALSNILGESVTTASVPGGYYSVEVARAAAHSGVRYLFTSEPTARTTNIDGCRVFGRYSAKRSMTPETMAALVQQRPLARIRERTYWDAKKVVKAVGGDTWITFRKLVLRNNR